MNNISGMKMCYYTVRCFAKAIRFGSKYVYQTVPRLLTLWLDAGEDRTASNHEAFKRMNEIIAKAIKEAPVYKVDIILTLAELFQLISFPVVHCLSPDRIPSWPHEQRSV